MLQPHVNGQEWVGNSLHYRTGEVLVSYCIWDCLIGDLKISKHNFCSLCHNYTSIYPLFFILCDYSLVLLMFRGLQIEAHILKVDFAITPSEMRVNTAVELNIQYNNILSHILIFSTFLLHLCMHSIKFYNYWEKCLLP